MYLFLYLLSIDLHLSPAISGRSISRFFDHLLQASYCVFEHMNDYRLNILFCSSDSEKKLSVDSVRPLKIQLSMVAQIGSF